jgi:hypothetical protein
MPRGEGFIEYATFEAGYQTLKRHTDAFASVTAAAIEAAVRQTSIAFIVFRCILGFTPPEWAYVTTEMTGLAIDQGAARSLDRRIRLNPLAPLREGGGVTDQRVRAMIDAGVQTLIKGTGIVAPGLLHRLDKADTKDGIPSIQPVADLGVPYPVLLYERFLGRPFATHRKRSARTPG